ncbi:MAG: hypothetical protein QUU85_10995 [Candidatus Eisenbacteria bacterium]|nr:hypothetical protein [Candidatus Eisenbacteria bacterium]
MSEMPPGARRVVLLSDDLIFSSRIEAIAKRLRLAFRRISQLEAGAALDSPGGVLLVDLDAGIEAIRHAIDAARAGGQTESSWSIWGFGSHVDAGGLRALREAGTDQVWPRSASVRLLEVSLHERFTNMSQ